MTSSPLINQFESGDNPLFKTLRFFILLGGRLLLCFTGVVELTWPQQIVLGILTVAWSHMAGPQFQLLSGHPHTASRLGLLDLPLWILEICHHSEILRGARYPFGRAGRPLHLCSCSCGGLCLRHPLPRLHADGLASAPHAGAVARRHRRMARRRPAHPHLQRAARAWCAPLCSPRWTSTGPPDKLNVYILDDGRRDEFRDFAAEAGIGYMTRDRQRARQGRQHQPRARDTDGELSRHLRLRPRPDAHLPADDGGLVPARPQAGDAADAAPLLFARSVRAQSRTSSAAFPTKASCSTAWCRTATTSGTRPSSAAPARCCAAAALEEIGGIAVETVTEDAHTSLRMQMRGWNTAYINMPQAAGLATERSPPTSASACAGRAAWCRSCASTIRCFGRGLHVRPAALLLQRDDCTFFYALPRLIFLTAPLIYLSSAHVNIPGYWAADARLRVAAPRAVAASTNSRIQGQHRHSFWNEIYETVLAPYILLPTMLALINPKLGKFNVTAKGGVVDQPFFDTRIAQPFLLMVGSTSSASSWRSRALPVPVLGRIHQLSSTTATTSAPS